MEERKDKFYLIKNIKKGERHHLVNLKDDYVFSKEVLKKYNANFGDEIVFAKPRNDDDTLFIYFVPGSCSATSISE